MLRSFRRAAAGLMTALVLVACNDGEPSAPATPTRPTTIADVDVDREKSTRTVLTAADVPGFVVDPPDPNDGGPDIDEAANACLDNNPLLVRLGEKDDRRGAVSPDFTKGDTQNVGSSATFGETEDEARSAITALSAASFPGCFSEAAASGLRTSPTFTNVSVNTTRLPALHLGDQNIGYRSVIRATVGDRNVTFYADFTFIRTGRALAVLNDFSVSTPFPEAERARLATAIAGRMAGP